ncbi:MAG: type B DNA-directed DNA polymerase [Candidatus Nanohaloarchaea archaeon]
MVFKIDFVDGDAVTWTKTRNRVEAERHPGYRPRFYIEGDRTSLHRGRPWLSRLDGVDSTCFETWKPTLSKPEKKVLRVDTFSEDALRSAVNRLKKSFGRSEFRFYNVGFSPQFRFCLQRETCPVPEFELDRMDITLHRKYIASGELSGLKVDGEEMEGSEGEAVEKFHRVFERRDPDLLMVNRGQVLELLETRMNEQGLGSLGRAGSFEQVAGENTVHSYGKTVHSASRYNVPGRVVIDRSNSFLIGEATLEGFWDLVERSYRPMQELAWGSIGRLLTSIEVRRAYLEEKTLTPWKNWSGEQPKKASTMHRADRGGFIFNPEPSIHENVYEADFASLFPNIMVKKNISPETVNCGCCDNDRVPELDYSICDEEGFIPRVLEPLVEDRQRMKKRLAGEELDEKERRDLQGSVDAIKWLLVSCFGYMGHCHASYGAIECHQAIQAFDREIMVETKEMFEDAGYSIAHGIIDSIWVQKKRDAENFEKVCEHITQEIGIELEPEHEFEWVAFVPRSSSDADIATLNRYFGKKKSGGFKTAGIEVEQSSSPGFVKDSQMEMIEALDREMSEEDVLDVLREKVDRLESGEVDPDRLVVEKKASKALEDYQVSNRTVAAMKRARQHGIEIKPGQRVRYVVRNDNAPPRARVRLAFENTARYDTGFYRTQLVRAAESVLSPLGMDREDVRRELKKTSRKTIHSYL